MLTEIEYRTVRECGCYGGYVYVRGRCVGMNFVACAAHGVVGTHSTSTILNRPRIEKPYAFNGAGNAGGGVDGGGPRRGLRSLTGKEAPK